MKRTVIIIGFTGGIGKILFDQYSELGIDEYGDFHAYGASRSLGLPIEITDPTSCNSLAERCRSCANIQIINCAGINYNSTIEKSEEGLWREVIETNLIGAYNLLKAFTPIMKEQGYGRFMFMSSVAEKGFYGTSAYSASKAGLEGLVRSAAKELLKHNITVNALRLGYFNAGLIKDVPKRLLDEVVLPSTAGELCDPTGLFDVIEGVFKCGDMTGSIINVDRGV